MTENLAPCGETTAAIPGMFLPVASSETPLVRQSALGLGIVPDPDDGTGLLRYSVVHLGSGLAVFGCVTGRCSAHAHRAIALMALSGIDWTQPPAALREQPIEATWQFLLDSYWLRSEPEATQMAALWRFLLDSLPLCFDPEAGKATRCLGDVPTAGQRVGGAA